jgi:hypothetical protein
MYAAKVRKSLERSKLFRTFAAVKTKKVKMWKIFILLLITSFIPAGAQTCGFSIDTIPDAVFARMQGRSFPANCTVKREELRYLRVLHRNAEDSVCQGELVCNQRIAEDLLDIFRKLYEAHYPIERIRLIDDYDADDERSMADNNSSCFCYRTVSGSNTLSNHARGLAIDINTRYNPYVRRDRNGRQLVSPENGKRYADRSVKSPYKIVEGDLCHRLFLEHGFSWGGSWRTKKDYQHFEK